MAHIMKRVEESDSIRRIAIFDLIYSGDGRSLALPLEETCMKALKGSKTHDNLKAAFAGESQANRRYLYFAAKADVEGQNDVSALFRSTAEGETGHAHGHLEYLEA